MATRPVRHRRGCRAIRRGPLLQRLRVGPGEECDVSRRLGTPGDLSSPDAWMCYNRRRKSGYALRRVDTVSRIVSATRLATTREAHLAHLGQRWGDHLRGG